MPNGRGKIDCIYCVHFDAQFDAKGYTYGKGEERACGYHQVIPRNRRMRATIEFVEIFHQMGFGIEITHF